MRVNKHDDLVGAALYGVMIGALVGVLLAAIIVALWG